LAFITKKELLTCALMSIVVLGLLFYFWPYPGSWDMSRVEKEAMDKALRNRRPRRSQHPGKNNPGKASLLEDMEKAAAEMAKQFPAVRKAVLQAAKDGKIEEAQPYLDELPAPGESVVVHLHLVHDGVPTYNREKGRSRVTVEGLGSIDFDNARKTGPDYKLLACVLAAMRIRRQADSGEDLIVKLVPVPFTPLESVRKVLAAAVSAGVTGIKLKQPPLPH
jgi:hypothetical protein